MESSSALSCSYLPWEAARRALDNLGFAGLVFVACFSYPLTDYRGDTVTLFDAYLVVYVATRLLAPRLRVSPGSWKEFFAVWCVYLIYLGFSVVRIGSPFSFLLFLKHVEHVVLAWVVLDRILDREQIRATLEILLYVVTAMIIYQVLYFHNLVAGIGTNYRLGIPFAFGVSSNPAGFVLAAWIVLLVHVPQFWKSRPWLTLASVVLAAYALLQTQSRTNQIALLIVLFATVSVSIVRLRRGWLWLTIGSGIVAGFFLFALPHVPTTGSLGRIVRILREPLSVFSDGSFSVRYRETWPSALRMWLSRSTHIYIGAGLAFTGTVDGTVPRLLANQGVIGLTLFAYVWYGHFLLRFRSRSVVMLLILSVVNGINGETLVVSYRSIQVFLILVMFAAVSGSSAPEESNERTIHAQ